MVTLERIEEISNEYANSGSTLASKKAFWQRFKTELQDEIQTFRSRHNLPSFSRWNLQNVQDFAFWIIVQFPKTLQRSLQNSTVETVKDVSLTSDQFTPIDTLIETAESQLKPTYYVMVRVKNLYGGLGGSIPTTQYLALDVEYQECCFVSDSMITFTGYLYLFKSEKDATDQGYLTNAKDQPIQDGRKLIPLTDLPSHLQSSEYLPDWYGKN